MPRATWPLRRGSPCVRAVLTLLAGKQPLPLFLLADTGAGSSRARFELILEESDCLLCGGKPQLRSDLEALTPDNIPFTSSGFRFLKLDLTSPVEVVGVPTNPRGFEGIAGFRFLNRFTYGNFGNPAEFGLET